MAKQYQVVFAIYHNITQLDLTGPLQFLSRLPNACTTIASLDGGNVETDSLIIADTTPLESVENCDLLCVPGGWAAAEMSQDDAFIGHIQRLASQAEYVTSVCTGSLILGAAGLLDGKRATTHWAWCDQLARYGAIYTDGRVVRDGNILTGGGVTAGIDFGLTMFAEIAGSDAAQLLQLGLEYTPQPPFNSGSPNTAPAHILKAFKMTAEEKLTANKAILEN